MDLTNYKRIKKRITESRENCGCSGCSMDCKISPLYSESTGPNLPCAVLVDVSCPKKTESFVKRLPVAQSAVAKWDKERPIKTRQSEMLKIFPNLPLDRDGIIGKSPCILIETKNCHPDGCVKCREDFWLGAYEEPKGE